MKFNRFFGKVKYFNKYFIIFVFYLKKGGKGEILIYSFISIYIFFKIFDIYNFFKVYGFVIYKINLVIKERFFYYKGL